MPQTSRCLTPSLPFSIAWPGFKGLNLKFIWAGSALIAFSLLVVSIYQLNAYTSDLYFIRQAEKNVAILSQENKVLEMDLAKANSLWSAKQYVHNFEKTDRIEYIKILENTALAR
jgi:hypothetical protein